MTALRPYLIRAVYEWIVDNAMTPYILVDAEREGVEVPRQYAQNGKIVLNLSPTAVVNLQLGNAAIAFKARFGGMPLQVQVPVNAVLAIYAKETGQGMIFDEEIEPSPPTSPKEEKPKRPSLKVVK
nr:stringent starvation protein B [uncultured Gammaproteobacteria bacterium]BAL54531.1 stringent starvation protein B [uncultured Gammaproteobacteria bacterium]BAL56665.1 stringent starvation protein B [uncultured Gammaproteobacteria bacterium]